MYKIIIISKKKPRSDILKTSTFSVREADKLQDYYMLSQSLMDLPGVTDVDFSRNTHSITVTFDESITSSEDIVESITLGHHIY
jgi:hypothetical protein